MTILTKPVTMLSGAALLLATACANPDDGYRNTRQGAAVGTALGAAVGAMTSKDKGKGALKGAVIGAAAGGLIGSGLDKQEADLRRSIGNENVIITNTGDRLIVTMPQDILFATDSAVVRADLQRDLRAVASNLQAYPNSTIQIIGHTDNTGAAAYNQDLSQRRASAVASVLLGAGVSGSRVQAFGRGESQPVASNMTVEGRAQNRRVEIVILPNA